MSRTVVPVQLETLRMVLGEKLYKNYRSSPGDLLWMLTDTHLYIGDVSPHQTLLAMATLKRYQCPEPKFKSQLMPLIKKMSPELGRYATEVNLAGACKLDGSDVVTSPGAFGLGEMTLPAETEAEILAAAAKHFRDYKVPSETGAYRPDQD